jgi:hypothetical protein
MRNIGLQNADYVKFFSMIADTCKSGMGIGIAIMISDIVFQPGFGVKETTVITISQRRKRKFKGRQRPDLY